MKALFIMGVISISCGIYNFFYGGWWERYNLNSITGVYMMLGGFLIFSGVMIRISEELKKEVTRNEEL